MLLFSDKSNLNSWFFIVIEAHLSIVLIVVLMLKECDPLSISAYATIKNNRLRDADTSELALTVSQGCRRLAHDNDLILAKLVG